MLLSIVIPTHNRFKYAKGCIDSIIGLSSSEVEIIISDSSVSNDLAEFVSLNYSFYNVKVLRPDDVNNAVENFNYSINHAKGDYILMLGDDDTVLPNIVDLLRNLKEKEVESIRFNFPYEYFWDDCYEKQVDFNNSIRVLPYKNTIVELDSISEAIEAGNNFGHGVLNMPRAYLGVMSKNLLTRINSKYGELFGGVSPDIYSSLLISYESRKTVQVDYPVVIPGSSGASTSGKSVNGKHVSKLRDNDHISAFPNLIWDKRIPEFYSTHTVWSYSYIQAKALIDSSAIPEPNYYRLYLKCLYKYPHYYKYTLTSLRLALKNDGFLFFFKLVKAIYEEISWGGNKLITKLDRKKISRVRGVVSLSSCVEYIHSMKNKI